MLSDFPKIHCPFVRVNFPVNIEQWREYGNSLQLRSPRAYLAVNTINPGYEWVFDDKDTFAVEKLDGTNLKILVEGGRLVAIQNRKNSIDPLQLIKGKSFLQAGVFMAAQKGLIKPDGEQSGELIGPKVQGNPLGLDEHLFYPFDVAVDRLKYRSFNEHDRTFDNWSEWFKDWLFSRFCTKRGRPDVFAEGVVFYNLRRREEGKTWMAKLRRNMFEWYYSDKIEILGYDPGAETKELS